MAPDLAISTTDIILSDTLPLTGTLVPVTVHNLGLGKTGQAVPVNLILDAGLPGATTIATGTVPAGLAFQDVYTWTVTWTAVSGPHALTARVRPPVGQDLDATNNEATVQIGRPEAPQGLTASANMADMSVGLLWLAVPNAKATGYKVYRALGSGALMPAGATRDPGFRDASVRPGQRYRYVVTAVGPGGVESPVSEGVWVTAPGRLYLPIIVTGR